jgi:MGT family glycosyltransferase
MNYLFAMFQGGGNIPLIVPIAAELVRRGHAVRAVVGPGIRADRLPVSEGLRARLTNAGVDIVPLDEPTRHPLEDLPPVRGLIRGWAPKPLPQVAQQTRLPYYWSSTWAQNASTAIERLRPDALVADYFLFGALVAGEAAGIPVAALCHNVPPPLVKGMPPRGQGLMPPRTTIDRVRYGVSNWARTRVIKRNAAAELNRARLGLGLATLSDPQHQYARADRLLVLASKEFDFASRSIPANVRYVGTPIDDAEDTGNWENPWPATDSRPLLLVSLSTLNQGQARLLSRIVAAVAELPLRVLVTLGPSVRRDDFDAPANVIFEDFVPHSAVMRHCAGVVSQCGLGTVTKALVNEVPLVCVPLIADQPDNAARVVARGAGLRLSPGASVDETRATISAVLSEDRFRMGAQLLGERLRAVDGATETANEIESLSLSRRSQEN